MRIHVIQTGTVAIKQVHAFCRTIPTVYLPAHDPDTPDRLANRQLAVAPATPTALTAGAG